MKQFEVTLIAKVLMEAHDEAEVRNWISFLFEKGNGIDQNKFRIEVKEK